MVLTTEIRPRNLFLLIIFSIYFVGCGSIKDIAQNNLYAVKHANKQKTTPEMPEGYQSVNLEVEISHPTEDFKDKNMNINLWSYRNAENEKAPVLIYFHGNAVNIFGLYNAGFLKKMESLGTHFVVLDYPSYGGSTGYPTQYSVEDSAQAALNWARSEFTNSKVIIWGRSLGAAVATQLVNKNSAEVEQMVLTSPWSNLYSLMLFHFEKLIDKLPAEWFNINKWDSNEAAKEIRRPVLIHHGDKDEVIPHQFGKEISEKFSGTVKFSTISEKGHNDILGDPQLWSEIYSFIKR